MPQPTTDKRTVESWVGAFIEQHGRPPRVLHVGNIANNAYLNAKIQRRAGIDADVVSPDYYHVMGCPEWEDAEFEGDVDEFHPDWWSGDLGGWQRPRWFVQGPMHTCIDYLLALRGADASRAARLWEQLESETRLISARSRAAKTAGVVSFAKLSVRHPGWALRRLKAYTSALLRSHASARAMILAVRKTAGAGRALAAMVNGVPPRRALAIHVFPTRWASDLQPEAVWLARFRSRASDLRPEAVWLARFRSLLPDRKDQLGAGELAPWLEIAQLWSPVFAHYDVVQAYAVYPIVPLLAGSPAFTAYEHGTLREIPFEDSSRGRITALGYLNAPAVFVTNADDLDAARRLGIPDERVVALPHAVDTTKLFEFGSTHARLVPATRAQPTFLAPARHEWADGVETELKGNDRIVRAVAILRDRGHRPHVVCVNWGRHVAETRALIAELGCEESFAWIPPMRKSELWKRYLSSHAVLDQFVMTAIGGVTFEAMALGRRVITSLDHDVNAQFFGETPPVLVAREVEEIAAEMERVMDDADDAEGRGAAARAWVERRHSAELIVDLQVREYARLVAADQPA